VLFLEFKHNPLYPLPVFTVLIALELIGVALALAFLIGANS